GIDPPLVLMLTLLGVHGYKMAVNPSRTFREAYPIDRDSLIIPERVIEDFDADVGEVLKPCFDAIWNAAGWPKSINYDDNGKRIPR
ncbi:MAG: ATP-binding protein, partial [Chloroflexota bacterium]